MIIIDEWWLTVMLLWLDSRRVGGWWTRCGTTRCGECARTTNANWRRWTRVSRSCRRPSWSTRSCSRVRAKRNASSRPWRPTSWTSNAIRSLCKFYANFWVFFLFFFLREKWTKIDLGIIFEGVIIMFRFELRIWTHFVP